MGDKNFWNERYLSDNTGWDMHQVSPPLQYFIDQQTKKALAVLIPGCGNAYEAMYLLQQGFTNVTLVDISSVLVERLRNKLNGQPIKIINEDFFEHRGSYELILEQTFFCAIDPSRRQDYVKHAWELLQSQGKIAGVLFNEHFGFEDHPPYKGSEAEYRELFEPYFRVLRMEPCDISIEPRMGHELIFELERRDEKRD